MIKSSLFSLLILLLLVGPAPAQQARCDCQPTLRHLCRCGVLIEQDVAEIQLAYLNRLMLAEFRDFLSESPVTTIRLAPAHKMVLKGESAQGYYDSDEQEMVINDSLRRDEALMVMAHELGHAWHFKIQPNPDAISDFLAEGFAEWVAYHLIKRTGLVELCSKIKTNPDPLYGDGFRWYFQVEQNFGPEAVINIMRTWTDLEGGRVS